MGFRFSKRISLFPGVKLNLGLGGVSASIGGRGASVNIGKRGVFGNLSLPGSGLSYRTRLDSASSTSSTQERSDSGSSVPEAYYSQRHQQAVERHQRLLAVQAELKQVKIDIDLKTGDLILKGASGEILIAEAMRYVFQSSASKIAEMLQAKIDELNETERLFEIHMDAPNPAALLSVVEPFPEDPVAPLSATAPFSPRPPAPLGFFASLLPWCRKTREEEIQARQQAYETALDRFYTEVKRHQQECEDQANRKAQWIQAQNEIQRSFDQSLVNDTDFMGKVLDSALEELDWPRETLINYEILDQGKTVYLDVDLPEIEDLPELEYSMAANQRKALVKSRTATRLREDYSRHIHGIAFRLVAVTMAHLPAAQTVFISGFSQRRDKSTGHINDEYLYSYQVDRDGFQRINFAELEHLEPAQALLRFPARINSTATLILKPIQPFTP